jgi:ADP-ribose pyrophosphatase YjhB (NUDIX family)
MAHRNPSLAVDVIIHIQDNIVLVKRKNPPHGWALPGGFVEYGETVESAVRREAREETGLQLENLHQYHVYSAPDRDPRRHTVSVVFTAQAHGTPCAASDAYEINLFSKTTLPDQLAFDHQTILADYFHKKY